MPQANKLLEQLWDNPAKFREAGQAYQLLQEYFAGLSLLTLQDMLSKNADIDVIRVGVWIASELGPSAEPLISYVLPLLDLQDRYVSYHVLDVLAACSTVSESPTVLRIAEMMGSDDEIVARRAAVLLSRLGDDELLKASQMAQQPAHREGLALLLGQRDADIRLLAQKASSTELLERRYAAAALKRRGVDIQKLTQMPDMAISNEALAIIER